MELLSPITHTNGVPKSSYILAALYPCMTTEEPSQRRRTYLSRSFEADDPCSKDPRQPRGGTMNLHHEMIGTQRKSLMRSTGMQMTHEIRKPGHIESGDLCKGPATHESPARREPSSQLVWHLDRSMTFQLLPLSISPNPSTVYSTIEKSEPKLAVR